MIQFGPIESLDQIDNKNASFPNDGSNFRIFEENTCLPLLPQVTTTLILTLTQSQLCTKHKKPKPQPVPRKATVRQLSCPTPHFTLLPCSWNVCAIGGGQAGLLKIVEKVEGTKHIRLFPQCWPLASFFHKALQIGADPEAISVWGLQIQFLWLQRHTCFWIPLLTGLRSQFSPAISIFPPLGTHHFFKRLFCTVIQGYLNIWLRTPIFLGSTG